MKRIFIDKKDTPPRVIEKILETSETEVTLVIPLNAALADSISHFQLLKREAEAAGKGIAIESVDKKTLALAKKTHIEATHPLFGGSNNQRFLSDIVASKEIRKEERPKKVLEEESEKSGTSTREFKEFLPDTGRDLSEKKDLYPEKPSQESLYREEPRTSFPLRRFKPWAIVLTLLIVIGGAGWSLGMIFGRAEARISFKKVPWPHQDTILASKTFSQIDVSKSYLPDEFFSQEKNMSRLFPASGKATVAQKAAAKIIIYNAYSASPQSLIATTRFMTPDGKVFRLNDQVLVPGAQMKGGKIVPSSIEANVTADKAGKDYNIGPIKRLTIPGFKGSPKYEGFYAALPQPAKGGFTGEKALPTQQEIVSAKDKTAESLRADLETYFLNNRPEGFVILPGASETQITKLTVNTTTDQSGNFSVFGEATFRALGFKEADLKKFLSSLAAKDYPEMIFRDLKLDYGNVKTNFDTGQLTFTVTAQGVLGPQFSADDLKLKISGRGVSEARAAILNLPDLASAKISLWPFWLYRLPANPQKIKIIAD